MSNQVQLFENANFGSLEILMIGEKPYFPATECAKVLGYSNPHDAIKKHCPHLAKREVGVTTGIKGDGTPTQQTVTQNFIPEGDLYRLIVRSKLPAAVKFEQWVFDEILPEIRKSGAYITESALKEMLQSSELFAAVRPPLSEFNKTARLIADILKDANVPHEQIAVNIAKMYEPLGITVYLDGMGGEKIYTASEIARINGILSVKGKPHAYAVSAIISILKIGDEYKIVKPYQLGETVVISVKYDEYVVNAVREWLEQNNWPCEIVCGKKIYKVAYKNRESVLEGSK